MAMPALRSRRWTPEEVDRLIDEREARGEHSPRYELVNGELLVTPGPNGGHQRIIGELFVLLHPYLAKHHLGELGFGPGEVHLTPDSRFAPDLYVIPAINGRRAPVAPFVTRMLLAVEVLSPSSKRYDRITKRRFFQQHELSEYWIVDGKNEAFEIWHPGDEHAAIVRDRFAWQPAGAAEPFVLDVERFFAGVRDEPV